MAFENSLIQMSEEEAKSLIKDYQTTRNQLAFEKLYEACLKYIRIKISKSKIKDDLLGKINERFLTCVITYDETVNPSFFGYLGQYIHFETMKEFQIHVRNNVGGWKISPKGKRKMNFDMKLARLDEPHFSENGKDPGYLKDGIEGGFKNWEEVNNDLHFQYILNNHKIDPRDLKLIKMLLDGYPQKEIIPLMGVSQSRVSVLVKTFAKRNPSFAAEFKQYLQDKVKLQKSGEIT